MDLIIRTGDMGRSKRMVMKHRATQNSTIIFVYYEGKSLLPMHSKHAFQFPILFVKIPLSTLFSPKRCFSYPLTSPLCLVLFFFFFPFTSLSKFLIHWFGFSHTWTFFHSPHFQFFLYLNSYSIIYDSLDRLEEK